MAHKDTHTHTHVLFQILCKMELKDEFVLDAKSISSLHLSEVVGFFKGW